MAPLILEAVPHIRPDETVASALAASDSGLQDSDNARLHGVAVKTIRRWRRDYQRRGKPRGQSHLLARCPRCEGADLDPASYAELLGWYLGDGHISLGRRGVYSLHVFNDKKYVKDIGRIQDLMRQVKPRCRPHTREVPGCTIVTVGWKHWTCLFPQHGPGRKHDRRLVLEPWQQEIVLAFPAALLRGLFHSDGCRAKNWTRRLVAGEMKRYDYPRWQFVNNSIEIRRWCCESLDLLEIPWRQSSWKTISVSTRCGVSRLDELIGLKG